jgi:hypothetical protein
MATTPDPDQESAQGDIDGCRNQPSFGPLSTSVGGIRGSSRPPSRVPKAWPVTSRSGVSAKSPGVSCDRPCFWNNDGAAALRQAQGGGLREAGSGRLRQTQGSGGLPQPGDAEGIRDPVRPADRVPKAWPVTSRPGVSARSPGVSCDRPCFWNRDGAETAAGATAAPARPGQARPDQTRPRQNPSPIHP